jgi:hypothetical protein
LVVNHHPFQQAGFCRWTAGFRLYSPRLEPGQSEILYLRLTISGTVPHQHLVNRSSALFLKVIRPEPSWLPDGSFGDQLWDHQMRGEQPAGVAELLFGLQTKHFLLFKEQCLVPGESPGGSTAKAQLCIELNLEPSRRRGSKVELADGSRVSPLRVHAAAVALLVLDPPARAGSRAQWVFQDLVGALSPCGRINRLSAELPLLKAGFRGVR